MAYSLPVFNLTCNVAVAANTQPINITTWYGPYDCQKYILSRQQPGVTAFTWWWGQLTPIFRIDPATFFPVWGDDTAGWGLSFVECPAGSGMYYRVFSWEIMHQGFSNAYPAVSAQRCTEEGFPIQPNSANNTGYSTPPLQPYLGVLPP